MMPSGCADETIAKPETTMACFGNLASEKALVAAAKNGNGGAFEALVERYRRRIIAVALRFTRLQEDAEDIVQQSFQKAYVHLHRFEGKSSFCTWLTRIAVNEALMLLRRTRALRQVSIDTHCIEAETGVAHLEIPDSHPDPEASCAQREQARILSAAMGKLRPALRHAIQLRELAELSNEETARQLGISVGAVKTRVFHGRKKLRQALKRYRRWPHRPQKADLAALQTPSVSVEIA